MMTSQPTVAATAFGAAPATVVGHRWGNWVLRKHLCRGSIADIYAAQPASQATQFRCDYVIKVLRREWHDQPLVLRQFQYEAALTSKLKNSHLLSSVDQLLDQQPWGIVYPFLPGQTVEQLLQQQGALLPAQALGITRQVATALERLHSAGILHGDLKPANIMVSPAGHVTLIDLGSAQARDEVASVWDRPILGTPKYLAPEQFVSKLRTDERTDLYSLGVVLFEMLTGRLPYAISQAAELSTTIREAAPIALRQLAPQLDQAVADLLQKLLAKNPGRRPESARQLIQQLSHLELLEIQRWTNQF
jgi:eukaryotic-like serine/threonine-protein kinase